jgi:hypothetical protein
VFCAIKACKTFVMAQSRRLAAWKGILLVASGFWMLLIAFLVRLVVGDLLAESSCAPSLGPRLTGRDAVAVLNFGGP